MKKDKKRPIGGDGRGDGGARERPGGGDDARAAKRWRGGNEKKRTKHAAAGTSDGRGVKPTTKNALRTAQLDKAQLLLFRKFDYGALLWRKYYRAQGIFRDDDELDDTAAAFATPLPVTFRLHATDARANHLKKRLKELQKVALVKPLPWMPNREGWQVVSTRAAGDDEDSHHRHHRRRRREKLPAAVAEVVDRGATAGLLARQEAGFDAPRARAETAPARGGQSPGRMRGAGEQDDAALGDRVAARLRAVVAARARRRRRERRAPESNQDAQGSDRAP